MNLKGKRIFLRVDWNVPLGDHFAPEDSLKISRSVETIRSLSQRGAIVIVATHLGRPNGREMALSTRPFVVRLAKAYRVPFQFLGDALDTADGVKHASLTLRAAQAGDVYLLENVRFYPGEKQNDPKLAMAFASLADFFVNDAFADCHRSHASIVGVAKRLKSYAGPSLLAEVAALKRLITKPKKPFVAIIGGAKISTKFDVLMNLLKIADRVMVGGAMANAFFAAKKLSIGKSFVEKEGIAMAKKFGKNPRIFLPTDLVVAPKLERGVRARVVDLAGVKKSDRIGDIGPETMRAWAQEMKKARTIIWNGPLGVAGVPTFSHGSLVIGRAIAARSKGSSYGVVGGGDTLPMILATGMSEWVDHLSTGGGAMLEFIAKKGRLPGLLALRKQSSRK
ncbi:MAG: phosphoglycerate kinase [Patescibacteria group bacterium]